MRYVGASKEGKLKVNQSQILGLIQVDTKYHDYASAAIAAHKGQMYDGLPYAYHLACVDGFICEFGFNEYEYRAAAWLHDTVEDTDLTVKAIAINYGGEVSGLVWAVTGEGKNRKERVASIATKLKKYPDAAVLKAVDRYANVTNGIKTNNIKKLKMYVKEWPEFRELIYPLLTNTDDRRKIDLFHKLDDLMQKAKELINDRASQSSAE